MPTTNTHITPVAIYIVYHPACEQAHRLATQLFRWFRLGDVAGDAAGAGLPVYYRRRLRVKDGDEKTHRIHPEIDWREADLNVVIPLADHHMVGDTAWREALLDLAEVVNKKEEHAPSHALLLPAVLHHSFFRTGPLYAHFNPVQLLGMTDEEMGAALRRAATEATTRSLRSLPNKHETQALARPTTTHTTTDTPQAKQTVASVPPPLDVFLSHAKRDGTPIAKRLRDGVRAFGQLVAWYDANDLPFGMGWESPMTRAAEQDTAALIATVTDAYATRPWCRREAQLARTPRRVRGSPQVWTVQPVLSVHQPGSEWVRGLPMLAGVPRMGWNGIAPEKDTARVVDRLVLEMLLAHTHRRVAQALDAQQQAADICYITWVPDAWTLIMLREALADSMLRRAPHEQGTPVRQIAYPGYGLSSAEMAELQPALHTFGSEVQLITYEEVRQNDPLGGKHMNDNTSQRIALSAGGGAEELAEHGLEMEHIDELMVRLSRKILPAVQVLLWL